MTLAAVICVPWVQLFEGAMLVCFGVSWPFLIVKTLRTRNVQGLSLPFVAVILAGYLLGIVAKSVKAAENGAAPEAVTMLYALNAVLVAVEIGLYLRYRRPRGGAGRAEKPQTTRL